LFIIQHVNGAQEQVADVSVLPGLIVELALQADEEHPDVAVILEDAWSVSIYSRSLVLENVESSARPWNAKRPADQVLLDLLETFVGEGPEGVRSSVEWRQGYPNSEGT
jgi:hypothetical protein